MDLRLPVTYRLYNLTDAVYGPGNRPTIGCDLTRVVYSDVVGEGYREKRALDDGYDAGSVWLAYRPIQMQGVLYAEFISDLWDRLQRLRRALTPTLAYTDAPGDLGFMPLAFSQRTGNTTDFPTGIMPLQMLARPSSQPHFIVDQDRMAGTQGGGFNIEWSAELWCRDPRIYVQPPAGQIASQVKPMSGTTGSGNATNRGDYPAPVDLMLYVAAGGPDRTFTFTGLGTGFTILIPGSGLARLVRVDSSLKVVTYQEEVSVGVPTETLRMDLIDFDAGLTYPRAPTSGTGAYNWSCTSTGLTVGSQLFYSEAFA